MLETCCFDVHVLTLESLAHCTDLVKSFQAVTFDTSLTEQAQLKVKTKTSLNKKVIIYYMSIMITNQIWLAMHELKDEIYNMR